ncbi:MAG: tRNA (guanosine(46)-N7)-methyltransferase TrmB [Oligoflexia bacterium]|nr:tRNA (guanosine(46)-N7)-methyltransferase TrmB [Oligoflexia bacterium]
MRTANSLKMSLTKNIPNPNIYIKMLPEYKGWIYLEEEALLMKGLWNSAFTDQQKPMDLEIGCGNGFFFEHQVRTQNTRNLLGIEIKYKPLVQTVRRIKKDGLPNGRGLRFHARYLDKIFFEQELNNVFIYFPDPWPRLRQQKNRLLRREFFEMLYPLQKPDCYVDIKTDDLDYFNFINEEISHSLYKVVRMSRDLHNSEWAQENFMTAFEKLFTRKQLPTYYVRLQK